LKEEKDFVQGIKDSIPGFSITYQKNDDVFIKENMYVEQKVHAYAGRIILNTMKMRKLWSKHRNLKLNGSYG
jgi:hypothetical protein